MRTFSLSALFRWITVLGICLAMPRWLGYELGFFFLFFFSIYLVSHRLSLRTRYGCIAVACFFASLPWLGFGRGWFGWPTGPEWPTLWWIFSENSSIAKFAYGMAELPLQLIEASIGGLGSLIYVSDFKSVIFIPPFIVFAFWFMIALVLSMSVCVTVYRFRKHVWALYKNTWAVHKEA